MRREARAHAHNIAKKAKRGPNSSVTALPRRSKRKGRKVTDIRGPRAVSQLSFCVESLEKPDEVSRRESLLSGLENFQKEPKNRVLRLRRREAYKYKVGAISVFGENERRGSGLGTQLDFIRFLLLVRLGHHRRRFVHGHQRLPPKLLLPGLNGIEPLLEPRFLGPVPVLISIWIDHRLIHGSQHIEP